MCLKRLQAQTFTNASNVYKFLEVLIFRLDASNVAKFSTILAFRQSFSVDLRVTDGVKFDLTPIYPLKWQKRMVKLKTVGQKWAKCLKRCQLFDGASFLTKCLKRFQMPQTFTLF